MTTNLQIASGADFDSLFQAGGGNQLFGIYGIDGQDVGQRYYNVSEGSAYGNTGFLASDGGDVGYKLCRAGSYHVFTMTVGRKALSGNLYYGYAEGRYGTLSPDVLNGYRIRNIGGKTDRFDIQLFNYAMPWRRIILTLLNNSTTYIFVQSGNFYTCSVTTNPLVQYYNQTIQFRLEVQ